MRRFAIVLVILLIGACAYAEKVELAPGWEIEYTEKEMTPNQDGWIYTYEPGESNGVSTICKVAYLGENSLSVNQNFKKIDNSKGEILDEFEMLPMTISSEYCKLRCYYSDTVGDGVVFCRGAIVREGKVYFLLISVAIEDWVSFDDVYGSIVQCVRSIGDIVDFYDLVSYIACGLYLAL